MGWKNNDLISLEDYSAEDILEVINVAVKQKANPASYRAAAPLKNKVLGLFFEKASLRTRLSFETAIYHLGGQPIYMGPEAGKLGVRESLKDMAQVSGRYLDALILRTMKHETILEIAKHTDKPVVNALSDRSHPCQALGDLLTVQEKCGTIEGKKIVYVGDANNVARSLGIAGAKLGAEVIIVSPEGYDFDEATVRALQGESKGTIRQLISLPEGIENADVVYTDVWTSMGQEAETAIRLKAFEGFEVDEKLMEKAPRAIVMHCLPAHRGEEISADVCDGPQSVIYDQAENRLHAQRALLSLIFGLNT